MRNAIDPMSASVSSARRGNPGIPKGLWNIGQTGRNDSGPKVKATTPAIAADAPRATTTRHCLERQPPRREEQHGEGERERSRVAAGVERQRGQVPERHADGGHAVPHVADVPVEWARPGVDRPQGEQQGPDGRPARRRSMRRSPMPRYATATDELTPTARPL